MDVHDHLPLAPRDLMILAVLAEGPTHGYGLIKSVEERSESGVLLDPANLYRTLRRMRELGWIEEAAAEDDRRRVHRITERGQAIVVAELARLERLLVQARPALAQGRSG
jgi:DNA-binding PadR family transcriptional regulator